MHNNGSINKGVSLNMLPPTSNAVQEHIHRAYYARYQMVTLLQPHKPTLLNPIAFGFKKTDELLLPVKSVKPIPEEYTILCNCKKCSNGRCACRKVGLPCISFCKCQSLQGVEEAVQCQNPSWSIKGWYIGLTRCVWLLLWNMNPRYLTKVHFDSSIPN